MHSDSRFGKSVGASLLVAGLVLYFIKRDIVLYFLVPGLVMLALGFFFPFALRSVNRLWMLLGRVLHKVTSPIIMGLVYFILIVPIGFFRRMARKNEMAKLNRNKESYWIAASEKPVNYNKQF